MVLIVIGILTGIAVPAYLQNQGRAHEAAAQANVRAAIPSIELYFTDDHTYVGISYAALTATYDAGLGPITFDSATATSYRVEASMQSRTFSKNGPAAPIVAGGC